MEYSSTIRHRTGLALMEAMIAVGILTLAVTAITSAIVAGQQQSLAARETIIGSVAAESLLATVSNEPWDSLDTWNEYTEDVGEITDPTGMPLAGDWDLIGRRVSIEDAEVFVEPLMVYIRGRNITVVSFSKSNRILSTIERFVPEPQS